VFTRDTNAVSVSGLHGRIRARCAKHPLIAHNGSVSRTEPLRTPWLNQGWARHRSHLVVGMTARVAPAFALRQKPDATLGGHARVNVDAKRRQGVKILQCIIPRFHPKACPRIDVGFVLSTYSAPHHNPGQIYTDDSSRFCQAAGVAC
jgi:hypothetical protein